MRPFLQAFRPSIVAGFLLSGVICALPTQAAAPRLDEMGRTSSRSRLQSEVTDAAPPRLPLPKRRESGLDKNIEKSPHASTTVEAEHLRRSLLEIAQSYGQRTYVPYVWGGNAIGDQVECESCRACVDKSKHLPVKKRRSTCQVCKRCGVDCSHFVHRLLNEAGLDYPYLATPRLKGMSADHLRDFNLVDIGRDLRRARPGDLLLQDHHIVMLLAMDGPNLGDLIHVSRSVKHGHVGGIEILRRMNIAHLRGKVVRILRHVALDSDSVKFPPIPNFRHIYPRTVGTGVTRLVLAP